MEEENTTYIMRGQEGLTQHITDPGTLKAVVYTSIRHLADHLHTISFQCTGRRVPCTDTECSLVIIQNNKADKTFSLQK
jgi:hypothetical protein